jgi:hypothetical protein
MRIDAHIIHPTSTSLAVPEQGVLDPVDLRFKPPAPVLFYPHIERPMIT